MALELDHKLRLDKAAIQSPNLCHRFTERDLVAIAEFVWDGYQKDLYSRADWYRRTEAAMDLAMQVVEAKSFPWPNASNVTFPLVTIAALQFHARAYPAIIQGTEVVKCRVAGISGQDELERAYRVGCYMSYQVLEQDQAWEEQHDRLLLNIAIVGCAFKKSFYNAKLGYNNSQLVLARDLVVNYHAKSIEDARRKTHVLQVYRNEIYERAMAGVYRDVTEENWFSQAATYVPREGDAQRDQRAGANPPQTDWATPFRCLEQHVWIDLDGDGYDEPYVVTIEEGSKAVLRIVSRVARPEDVERRGDGRVVQIKAEEYFTKYGFIPAPDGGIYDVGFGILVGPLNESVNSILNQLIDAGTMANTAGGFLGRGAKVRSGNYMFKPLEWKRLDATGDDIKKNIFPLPVREPSQVLFSLLGLLIEYTNRISGATEMLAGENPGQNTKTGTVDTMVEQGLKIYGAIFKRIWRSMKEEFKKLYILNAMHLPQRITSGGVMIGREDFFGDPNRIVPCADPNVTSDKVRIGNAAALAQRAATVPGYDRDETERRLLRAMHVEEVDKVYLGAKQAPLPNPRVMLEETKGKWRIQEAQMKMKHEAESMVLQLQEEHDLNEAKISQLEAQATNLLAQAKGVDVTQQIALINSIVGAMREHSKHLVDRAKVILESMSHGEPAADHSGAIAHLVGGPGNSGAPALPGAAPGDSQGTMG